MAKFRNFACSKPGTACCNALSACTTLARPSISACVKLFTSVTSTPPKCTRLRLVASPASDRADQEPPKVLATSFGIAPASAAASNSRSRYGDFRSSSLPLVVWLHVRLQSLYVAGREATCALNRSVSTFAALKTVVTPRDSFASSTVYLHPAKCATSASPVQSMTRSAMIAWRPDFDSVTTPKTLLSSPTRASTTQMCSSGRTPDSLINWSATSLNCSASRQSESLYGHFVVPPIRSAMRSISRPMPSQSSVPS
mmetsp:Transcript_103113/g.315453  ORF Transcript_103113/g.315453 Transcript_103113/m.315453 type:complete len:255 (+) Transcript_103113:470-1234(+)